MITKRIRIKNIESHEDTVLELHPGVNMITGPSDVGKSTIIKCMYLLAFDRPLGKGYVSYWAKDGGIYLDTETLSISKIKGSQNVLKINGRKTDKEEVQSVLGITRNNFLVQGQPHFMLSWSPGERASYLNEITNLSIIDSATKKAKGFVKHFNSMSETQREALKLYKEELESYADIEDMEVEVSSLERMAEQHKAIEKEIQQILSLLYSLDDIESEIAELSKMDLAAQKKQIEEMLLLFKQAEEIEEEESEIEDLLHDLQTIEHQQETAESDLKGLRIKLDKLMPKRCPLCGK